MVTHDDLNWWLELASSLDWTFAKTYAETAPHHYVVEGRTPGVTHEDLVRAAHVIHTFGKPGKYYSLTKIYLVSPDGRHRWWTEDKYLNCTTLVNRAPTERFYGIQNALTTSTEADSPYDALASSWDEAHPIAGDEPDRARALMAGARGKYPPHVLDIGCGTGRVLDLGLATPDRYAGLDSSRAMLNMLIRKHPKVAATYPMNVEDALDAGLFTPGQFDWVFLDEAVKLKASQKKQIEQLARLAVVTVSGADLAVNNVVDDSVLRVLAEASAMRQTP
jgi:hypothetical protein